MTTCWKCDRKAVIYRKYEGKAWCGEHFVQQFESLVKETMRKEELIQNGDKVCLALSGGMDSSALVYFLSNLLREWRDTDIFALSIDEGIDGYRDESIRIGEELCEKLDVEHHVSSFKDAFGVTMDDIMERGVKPCTYCGVFRRWLLNRRSREFGATKLATAHNMDDELQSIFMNYLKGNMKRMVRLGAKPAVIENDKFVPRIKPFRDTPEREVALYSKLNELKLHLTDCKYVGDSVRFDVREFLNRMEQKYPSTKYTALRAFDKILPLLREGLKSEESPVQECGECGEVTSREICKCCELLERIETNKKG